MGKRAFFLTMIAVIPFAWVWSEAFDVRDVDGWLMFGAAAWWRWVGPYAEKATP